MESTLSYSVAIRTLGKSGEKFRKELESLHCQTILAERIFVYIAQGYEAPNFTVGKEEYIPVKKGMVAQRVLSYGEIKSDCILMLDDDVELAPDSVERMLEALEKNGADCVGADTFANHKMSLKGKVYAALTNLVFPHLSDKWAFKIHSNGSFSYNNRPEKRFYLSQSCAGPASLWRKEAYEKLHLEDELWLDSFGFAYGEDALEFYKLYKNGFKLGILYGSGVKNLDAGSSSGVFRKSSQYMYTRTKASFEIWWRTCFRPGDKGALEQTVAAICFSIKTLWQLIIVGLASIFRLQPKMFWQYIKGLYGGWKFVHGDYFRSLRSYVLDS